MDEARALYRYASDPEIGPPAAWAVHTSVQESMEVIRDVLSQEHTYAVVLKNDDGDEPIGSIGLAALSDTVWPHGDKPRDQMEIGYWIGRPFWGQALIPEAAGEIFRHGFEDLGLSAIWGIHDVENHKSQRVMDKLSMRWVRTVPRVRLDLLPGEVFRDETVRSISRAQWETRACDPRYGSGHCISHLRKPSTSCSLGFLGSLGTCNDVGAFLPAAAFRTCPNVDSLWSWPTYGPAL